MCRERYLGWRYHCDRWKKNKKGVADDNILKEEPIKHEQKRIKSAMSTQEKITWLTKSKVNGRKSNM